MKGGTDRQPQVNLEKRMVGVCWLASRDASASKYGPIAELWFGNGSPLQTLKGHPADFTSKNTVCQWAFRLFPERAVK